MLQATVLRDEIDRSVRPGQGRTAVVAHRLLRSEGFGAAGTRMLNRYRVPEGTNEIGARYGRSRYGRAHYTAPSEP